jgi:hypothetical protein
MQYIVRHAHLKVKENFGSHSASFRYAFPQLFHRRPSTGRRIIHFNAMNRHSVFPICWSTIARDVAAHCHIKLHLHCQMVNPRTVWKHKQILGTLRMV